MSGPVARVIGRLVIALGLILSGLGPVWAGAHPMTPAAMSMMPDMPMDHAAGSGKHIPAKQMPCDGSDCACCVGCPCTPPPCLVQADLLQPVGLSGDILFQSAAQSGITFAPSLRPPIFL